MDIIVMPTAAEAELLTARIIADAINAKPFYKLGLATGRTMENVYANLVKMYKAGKVDFSRVISFNLDEYVGLKGKAETNKDSYRYFMNYHLFNHVNIDKRNTHVPDGFAPADQLEAAAAAYEEEMEDAGGVDMQLLGIGRSGHIGFNEPMSSFSSRTRVVTLTKTTYEQNSPLFKKPEDMPMRAMTMGVGTCLDAKRLLLLATHTEKASIVAAALEGPVTNMISATALQLHDNAVVVLDADAASKLKYRDEYAFQFANDPKWAAYQPAKRKVSRAKAKAKK